MIADDGGLVPVPASVAIRWPGIVRLCVADEPRFADVPPARIVPMLADEGVYLGSESSFSRVLREHGQTIG